MTKTKTIKPINARYCLPIRTESFQSIQEAVKKHAATTQFFELWLDYITDLDEIKLQSLIESMPGRIICLFRRDKLEQPHMSELERRHFLAMLAPLNVFVDLDIAAQDKDVQYFASLKRSATFIASYHNYESTPEDMSEIIETMSQHSPDIYKVACFCSSESDAAQLISLKTELMGQQKRSIILGMGNKGMCARLTCDVWGNELVFAPIDAHSATAPGQFTRQQLETIQSIVGETT